MRSLRALAVVVVFLTIVVGRPGEAMAAPACGMVVGSPGTVTLTGNLNCGAGPGIAVKSGGVTIDMAGFRISGTGAYGVRAVGVDDLAITDGRIARFETGIDVSGGTGLVVTDVRVVRAQLTGVELDEMTSVRIVDSRIMRPGFGSGIAVTDSEQVSISGSLVSHSSADGIQLVDVTDFSVQNTRLFDSGDTGLEVRGTPGVGLVRGVVANRNGAGGITILDAAARVLGAIVTVDGSVANDNGNAGVAVVRSRQVRVNDTAAIRNSSVGIAVRDSGVGIELTGNRARSSGQSGFRVNNNTAAVELAGNTAGGNALGGFSVQDSAAISADNVAVDNGIAGFNWLTGSSGSSDRDLARANAWGGFSVGNDPGSTVVISDARSILNGRSGLRSTSTGTVEVSDGVYNDNDGAGIRIESGHGDIEAHTARRNGGSGVELWSGTTGTIDGGVMTDNAEWGLLIDPGSAATSLLNHVFAGNGLGGCSGC